MSGVALQAGTAAGGGADSMILQLRAALTAKLGRTLDLFREWDADESGCIDRGEFCQAVMTLGLHATEGECRKLFDSLDDDASGTIEYTASSTHAWHACLNTGA